MTEITFTVPGEPVSRQAHEPRMIGRRKKMCLPKETVEFQKRVALYGKQAMKGRPLLDGLLVARYIIAFTAPKKAYKGMNKAELESGNIIFWPGFHDGDNVAKSLGDALQKSVIVNDNRIVRMVIEKGVAREPRTIITIKTLH